MTEVTEWLEPPISICFGFPRATENSSLSLSLSLSLNFRVRVGILVVGSFSFFKGEGTTTYRHFFLISGFFLKLIFL